MSVTDDVQEIFRRMPEAFLPDRAGSLKAVFQIELTGEGAGAWSVAISDGTITVRPGKAESADVAIKMDSKDYIDLVLEKATPFSLFMNGKIDIRGDEGLAVHFHEMFDRTIR